jgi:glycosyltransferase involved in cell wall biosynthesis
MDAGGSGADNGAGRRVRVLLVIKCLGYGGAERLLVDTVATSDRTAFDCEVAYVLDAEDGLVPAIREGGTTVHPLGAGGNADLRWMGRLRSVLDEGSFDIVHFHLPYTAALGRLVVFTLPRARRPAIVYTEHSLWNKAAVAIRGLNRAGIGLDQSLIVVSDAAHEALPPALRDRARVIVHGLDVSRADSLLARQAEVRAEVRAELGVPPDQVLVMTVANLRPEKGYDVLLDAVRLMADRRLPVQVAAVGRGPLEDELRHRQEALGIADRLQFLGPRDDVLRLLAGSDVFVLASRQEGLPVSLMEATSMGMPIVATAVGGVPQVITDEVDGLIVPSGAPALLADALERMVTDPDLRRRLGRAAKEKSAMFDVAGASREIEGIYRQLVR